MEYLALCGLCKIILFIEHFACEHLLYYDLVSQKRKRGKPTISKVGPPTLLIVGLKYLGIEVQEMFKNLRSYK